MGVGCGVVFFFLVFWGAGGISVINSFCNGTWLHVNSIWQIKVYLIIMHISQHTQNHSLSFLFSDLFFFNFSMLPRFRGFVLCFVSSSVSKAQVS